MTSRPVVQKRAPPVSITTFLEFRISQRQPGTHYLADGTRFPAGGCLLGSQRQ